MRSTRSHLPLDLLTWPFWRPVFRSGYGEYHVFGADFGLSFLPKKTFRPSFHLLSLFYPFDSRPSSFHSISIRITECTARTTDPPIHLGGMTSLGLVATCRTKKKHTCFECKENCGHAPTSEGLAGEVGKAHFPPNELRQAANWLFSTILSQFSRPLSSSAFMNDAPQQKVCPEKDKSSPTSPTEKLQLAKQFTCLTLVFSAAPVQAPGAA